MQKGGHVRVKPNMQGVISESNQMQLESNGGDQRRTYQS